MTTPGSITIPETILAGKSITISWGASTDSDGSLEGYVVERSTDGGSSWTQVYQGSSTSTTNTVPKGSETVMYRVRAYDSSGLYSNYRTSGQVTVINNTPPTAPGSVSVPENVLGGGTLDITWEAATDVDGDLAGYELERCVNGGDFTQVYRGENLSYTDNITRGWTTVVYRVRAYDAYGDAGSYATSAVRTVNNNRAPVIVTNAAEDLGEYSEGFGVLYSATDEDGDTVTVTEAVDGTAMREFTVELGAENTASVGGETFFKLLNGEHTLSISAFDGQDTTTRRMTFSKKVTAATVTMETPFDADDLISVCVMTVDGEIPDDAEFTVEVTNNGKDDEPVWEDCTAETRYKKNYMFQNTTAANGYAFNFRVSVKRGESDTGGYIKAVKGGFQ
jgi:hypothetical protein